VSVNNRIATWLDAIGLPQYAAVFAENAIEFEILPDMTEADLEKLGVALGQPQLPAPLWRSPRPKDDR
jgi:SAM domain (Sterile alpha motif)